MTRPFFIIITGLSGSGKSTALKAIEDEGFFCMDNMPIELLVKFIEIYDSASFDIHKICICIDIRAGVPMFVDKGPWIISLLKNQAENVRLIFLEATKENLLNRFKETRRRHPLSDQYPNLLDAIEKEIEIMAPLREIADFVINTSKLNVHELVNRIKDIISAEDKSRDMYIEISSFGFKKGIPMDSDIVMDVRYLPNPYFVEELKDKDGSDDAVKYYLESFDSYRDFMNKLNELIMFIVPQCRREGRSYLNIAIGCTGGKHRSVAIAEALRETIVDAGYNCKLTHRDIS
ncbi:MAG: RNase adapter RapZ [Desulfomonilia bacterium]